MAQDEITATYSCGGMPSESKVSYPLPADPHAPPGYPEPSSDEHLMDFGLNEEAEVGHNGGVQCYGVDGPGAGGGVKRNKQE